MKIGPMATNWVRYVIRGRDRRHKLGKYFPTVNPIDKLTSQPSLPPVGCSLSGDVTESHTSLTLTLPRTTFIIQLPKYLTHPSRDNVPDDARGVLLLCSLRPELMIHIFLFRPLQNIPIFNLISNIIVAFNIDFVWLISLFLLNKDFKIMKGIINYQIICGDMDNYFWIEEVIILLWWLIFTLYCFYFIL